MGLCRFFVCGGQFTRILHRQGFVQPTWPPTHHGRPNLFHPPIGRGTASPPFRKWVMTALGRITFPRFYCSQKFSFIFGAAEKTRQGAYLHSSSDSYAPAFFSQAARIPPKRHRAAFLGPAISGLLFQFLPIRK